MAYENLEVKVDGAKATIAINRPKALNALNSATISELGQAFGELEGSNEVRVCIITGGGDKAFVAGADIGELKELDLMSGRAFVQLGHDVFNQLENSGIVTIAAVNGFALGGGCELAMACDIRLASEKAKLGQPEVGLGIMPGFGGTQRLPRLVGVGRAKELIFSARIIRADEALRIGLVDALYPPEQLLPEAEKLADTIASKGPLAVQWAKDVINRGVNMDLASANGLEINAFAAICATADKEEGLSAFLEKQRPPEFKGR